MISSELCLKSAYPNFLPKFRKSLVTGRTVFRVGNYRLANRKLGSWES